MALVISKPTSRKVLSFDKAMEIAAAIESVTQGTRDISSGMPNDTLLYHVSDRPPPVINIKCFHCGRSNHKPTECYFKDASCRKCKKKGHIECMCQSRG